MDRDPSRAQFESEVMPHLDAAYGFARWLCRNPADAEDVVHDAVVRAYRGFEDGRVADPRAWLLAIVRNCHLSRVRRLRPEASLSALDPAALESLPSATPTPEEESVRADDERSFARLLGALPLAQREILVLRELQELSYGEIAAVIGVPLGTVMSRIARARSALRELWLQHQPGVGHGLS